MNKDKKGAIENDIKDVMDLHGVKNFIILMDNSKDGTFSMTGFLDDKSILNPIAAAIVNITTELE